MNLLALIGALLLTYYRPHQSLDLLQRSMAPVAQWLERNFNGGKNRHGFLAWFLGAFVPSLIIGAIYYFLLYVQFLLGLIFGIAVLYFILRCSQFERRAEQIVAALRDFNIDHARSLYRDWEGQEADSLTPAQLSRVSIETALKRAHQGLFGPVLWFMLLGPAGALLYRLTFLLQQFWKSDENPRFQRFARRAFNWLDWLPSRITAASFAIVGDFEDAVYCWRTQSESWPDKALGIILASGAGALGVRLGDPLPEKGVIVYRPELGLGDEADADYLQSAIGLVWRVLVLMVSLLLLMTVAYWLGN